MLRFRSAHISKRAKYSSLAILSSALVSVPASAAPPIYFSIDASVHVVLHDVAHQGAYTSAILSPQIRFYQGNDKGWFAAIGDGLFSTIIAGPSDAKASGAAKLTRSQWYGEVGYKFHLVDPNTDFTIGVGYLNQQIDAASNKFGHGPFVGISASVPILNRCLSYCPR